MNILMVTNTYLPHVGGVARSVQAFTEAYRQQGHRVIIIAPEFPNMPEHEEDVLRVPALQRFNGTDFSVRLPVPLFLREQVEEFEPEVVHSHHPFLLGATAYRLAHHQQVPLVFTHHTMYERYTHYVPGDSEAMRRFAIRLSVGYCNMCDEVFAPSESVRELLIERGVEAPIAVVPTGVRLEEFDIGDGPGFRAVVGIPEDAFVVGHVGRLAEEKNLPFLTRCIAKFMKSNKQAHFLLVGSGPSLDDIKSHMAHQRIEDRFHYMGTLGGRFLASAYKAMDVFAFASQTETQGMVLTEAMAASAPVVAVDASGAREVVIDRLNGRLLSKENEKTFVEALAWVAALSQDARAQLRTEARKRAEEFSMANSAAKAMNEYQGAIAREEAEHEKDEGIWEGALEKLRTEWEILSNTAEAASAALFTESKAKPAQ